MEPIAFADPPVDGLRLMIVDDHALCCAGLAMMFRATSRVADVAVATTSEQAVRIAKLFQPHIVVLDAAMPSYRGFETARLLLESSSPCRILFLDDAVNHAHIRSALRVGAQGYWTKHATFDQILAAVLQIGRGQTAFCPAADQYMVPSPSGPRFDPPAAGTPLGKLTPRELEVLLHLADGLTVRRCAERMKLAESTVDNHKSRLMRKLRVHSVVELVRLAAREGLVQ
ncbi:MAG: response regulator transcription factor [Pirellulales bacterium]|nr:response regulator transcription factor [Pirellulales bacterium]